MSDFFFRRKHWSSTFCPKHLFCFSNHRTTKKNFQQHQDETLLLRTSHQFNPGNFFGWWKVGPQPPLFNRSDPGWPLLGTAPYPLPAVTFMSMIFRPAGCVPVEGGIYVIFPWRVLITHPSGSSEKSTSKPFFLCFWNWWTSWLFGGWEAWTRTHPPYRSVRWCLDCHGQMVQIGTQNHISSYPNHLFSLYWVYNGVCIYIYILQLPWIPSF